MEVSDASKEQGNVLRRAPKALLDARAVTPNAEWLAARLVKDLIAWEAATGARKYSRNKSRETLDKAIVSFLSDLLGARDAHEEGWVSRSMQAKAFTGQPVPRRTFGTLVDCWKNGRLLEHRPGYKEVGQPWEPGDTVFRGKGFVSRFRATQKLLDVCAEHGITPKNSLEHFRVVPPEQPLVLRASSTGVGRMKTRGKVMLIIEPEHTERLLAITSRVPST